MLVEETMTAVLLHTSWLKRDLSKKYKQKSELVVTAAILLL